jgi:hypothetical protein
LLFEPKVLSLGGAKDIHEIYSNNIIDDQDTFKSLLKEHQKLLQKMNGWIEYGGGLHVFGSCKKPLWHSLKEFWQGEFALKNNYENIHPTDIPFGQDYLGDIFFIRDSRLHILRLETGECEDMNCKIIDFLDAIKKDPFSILGLSFLEQYENNNPPLLPGQLISIYPPLCLNNPENKYSLKAVSVKDRMSFLFDFHRQIKDLPDKTKIQIKVRMNKI